MTKGLFGRFVFIAVSCVIIAVVGGGVSFIRRPVAKTCLVLWVIWWLVRFLGMQRGAASVYEQRQRLMVVLSGAIVIPMLIVAPPWEYAHYAGPIPRDGLLAWAGLFLFAVGIALQAAAIWALHGLYTTRLGVQAEHEVVTSGPYRWVRHPGYTSQIMCMTGIGLALSSLVGLGMTILVVPLILWRMQQEEEMLLAEFGGEYRAYRQQTKWRLIPLVF